MWPPNAKLPRSAPAVLNGRCCARLDISLSSLGVVLLGYMHNGGFSHRRVADHFRVNHSIIVRLMQRFRQMRNVTDRPRAGRPRKTTPREDRLISRRARQRPFSTAGTLRGNLAFRGHISTRTVIRCLHHQGMRARRPVKRPQLTLRHRNA
jgi:transposase